MCQKAAVVDIGVFGGLQSTIPNSILNEEAIDPRCSGKQLAMAIAKVKTVAIYLFGFIVLVDDLRL
jgi:hypothetical protein